MRPRGIIAPHGPEWHVDWESIESMPWVAPMRACTQDVVSHGEGDAWVHTRMVVDAQLLMPSLPTLPRARQEARFWAALLHDMAKPQTRVEVDGRVRNPGHSARGAKDARVLMWRLGVAREVREMACATILVHQAPFWLVNRSQEDAMRLLALTALCIPIEDVAVHAHADTLGRVCPDQENMLQCIDLFRVMAEDIGAVGPGYPMFANDHARVRYFSNPTERNVFECPPDMTDESFKVFVMSGLPGSGKSTTARVIAAEHDIPILSLDALRREMDIAPDENQGRVIQESQERARRFLRCKQSFVWDGINITVDQRQIILGLAHAYGARTEVVVVERSWHDTMDANMSRGDGAVPQQVIARMLRRWEAPTLAECHALNIQFVQAPSPPTHPVHPMHP